jgi:hypothetical protein
MRGIFSIISSLQKEKESWMNTHHYCAILKEGQDQGWLGVISLTVVHDVVQ